MILDAGSDHYDDDPEDPEDLMEDDDAIAAVELCDDILSACEDVPEAAEELAASIYERVESIRDWIVEKDHVTAKQQTALDNMQQAINNRIDRGW